MTKRLVALAVGLIVLWESANLILTTRATKNQAALTDLIVIESQLRDYAVSHHALPTTLLGLPKLNDGRDTGLVDPWGREFTYDRDAHNAVVLGTKGPDGVHGFTIRFDPYATSFPVPTTTATSSPGE